MSSVTTTETVATMGCRATTAGATAAMPLQGRPHLSRLQENDQLLRRHCASLPQIGGGAAWQHFVARPRSAADRLPKARCAKFKSSLGLTFARP